MARDLRLRPVCTSSLPVSIPSSSRGACGTPPPDFGRRPTPLGVTAVPLAPSLSSRHVPRSPTRGEGTTRRPTRGENDRENNRPTPSQLIDDALSKLEDGLRAGRSAQLEAYLALCARFHRYSFGNVLLIAVQCPHATHVAGFHAWKKLGRWVRKGEHGIAILAPQPIKARPLDPQGRCLVTCFRRKR